MDGRKRRSSLRRSLAADILSTEIKSQQKRRISFSGRKSVRVFSKEDEPKSWDNSFEISDHLNVNETAKNPCAPSIRRDLRSNHTVSHENKENFDQSVEAEQKDQTNLTLNNISVLRSTNDFINASDQYTRTCQIENSVDITLYESERRFQKEIRSNNHANTNLQQSFSFEDNEQQALFGEKSSDFMNNEYIFEKPCQNLASNISKSLTEPMQTSIGNTDDDKRKSIYELSRMHLSPNKTLQHDKENINPFAIQKPNETQNNSCQMEIEEAITSHPQTNENFNKLKLRPTTYFDQEIETSPQNMIANLNKNVLDQFQLVEKNNKPRPTINFNQPIDVDNERSEVHDNKVMSLPTIILNQPIDTNSIYFKTDMSRKTLHLNDDMNTKSMKFRQSVCFNKSIEVDAETIKVSEVNEHNVIRKETSRRTIIFNQPVETSPTDMPRKIGNVYNDIKTNNMNSRQSICYNQTIVDDTQTTKVNENDGQYPMSNLKPRGTMFFNQIIETSPICSKTVDEKQDVNATNLYSGQSIYLDRSIYVDAQTTTLNENNGQGAIPKVKPLPAEKSSPKVITDISRKTVNLNEDINTKNINLRPSICFNQSIEVDTPTTNAKDNNRHCAITEVKPRPTIFFDQPAETSPISSKANTFKKTDNLIEDLNTKNMNSRKSICFNRSLDVDAQTTKLNESKELCLTPKVKSRPTIILNQTVDTSPKNCTTELSRKTMHLNEDLCANNMNTRKSICFNQSIETDSENKRHDDKNDVKPRGTVFFNQPVEINLTDLEPAVNVIKDSNTNNTKARPSISFNQSIVVDSQTTTVSGLNNPNDIPANICNQILEKTASTSNPNKEMCESAKLSQDSDSTKTLSLSENSRNIQKHGKQKNIIFRKICISATKNPTNIYDLKKQRLLQQRRQQEEHKTYDIVKDNVAAEMETEDLMKEKKNLNFSLDSSEKLSLSSQTSSPMLPFEFRGYTMKQLNDEIECGKIKVFPNAPKTPITDCKRHKCGSGLKQNMVELTQLTAPARKSLQFNNSDLPLPCNQTSPNNSKNDFVKEKKKKDKYRYSQADDVMLDNTSFLTRAKLSDETVSRNSSKRDCTQTNAMLSGFGETLAKAVNKLEEGLAHSQLKSKDLGSEKNNTFSSSHPGVLPIFTSSVANENYSKNVVCSNDAMDTSKIMEDEHVKDVSGITPLANQPSPLQTKDSSQTIYFNADVTNEDYLNVVGEQENIRSFITNQESMDNATQAQNMSVDFAANVPREETDKIIYSLFPGRKTLYCNNDITIEDGRMDTSLLANDAISLEKPIVMTAENDPNDLNESKNLDFSDANKENVPVVELCKLYPMRETCYTNKIPFEHTTMKIKDNDQAKQYSPLRKTLFFEKESIINDENIAEKSTDVHFCNLNPSRKTLFYNDTISLENTLIEIKKNTETDEPNKGMPSNPCRKTIFFETKIQEQSMLNDESIPVEITNVDYCNLNPSRKTFYCNNEISGEHTSIGIAKGGKIDEVNNETSSNENNVRLESIDMDCSHLGQTRKTLCYDEEISLKKDLALVDDKNTTSEKCDKHSYNKNETLFTKKEIPLSIGVKENIQTDLNITNSCCLNRKTPFFSTKTSLEEDSKTNEQNVPIENNKIDSSNFNPSRKTLYYDNEILLETTTTENKRNFQEGKYYVAMLHNETDNNLHAVDQHRFENGENDNKTLNPSRKTIFFNKRISEFDSEVQVANDSTHNIMLPNENLSHNENIADNLDPNKNQLIGFNSKTLDANKYDAMCGRRKSVCTPQSMDMTLEEEELNENVMKDETNDLQVSNLVLDDVKSLENNGETTKYANEMAQIGNKELCLQENKILTHFEEISSDLSKQNNKFHESVNVAKMALMRQSTKNSLDVNSKLSNGKENDIYITPIKSSGINKMPSLYCITPRLSLLEFKKLERKISEENHAFTNKRSSNNLTPALSVPKKKHALAFEDCLIDDAESSKKEESQQLPHNTNPEEMSGIFSNQSLQQSPMRENKSRIPIPISSGKKTKKLCRLTDGSTNNIHNETDSQLQMEADDNFAESIELMRRATTFTQQAETTSEHRSSLKIPKPSIFEGNPITISDVSVFFEAQRKSHINITENEGEKTNSGDLIQDENSKKDFEHRFIDLTLEDIDKTRLSLVREDENDDEDDVVIVNDLKDQDNDIIEHSSQKYAALKENLLERRRARESVNYLRNESLVCRKCKRCQETLSNITTSSEAESFVLPELPPIPDLGLDRLRRLRTRPTIANVDYLSQRVSLNRTICTPNISDDDIEIISEDEKSVVSQFIRKYNEDTISCEMDLLGKQHNKTSSEKLPFVLRLQALLRENCKNWIFDYQMQFRGILLFTHKKFLTFTLSIIFSEDDPLGHDINLKSIKLEKGHLPKKNWQPIDFVLEFQLKLNLPFDIQSLCKGNRETDILKMLQKFDGICLDTYKMAIDLQFICFTNQASILRGGGRTYVRKVFRQIVNRPNTDVKYVKKTEIKVELFNLKKLSFKDIISPQFHYFHEEIHLLPTGLQFLREFLPNALKYLKDNSIVN